MKDSKTPERTKFIPCDEFSQTYHYQRTNRKATYRDLNMENKTPKKKR